MFILYSNSLTGQSDKQSNLRNFASFGLQFIARLRGRGSQAIMRDLRSSSSQQAGFKSVTNII